MRPEISLVLLQRAFASGGVLPSAWPFGLFDRRGKTMPLSAETLEEYAKVCVELARESHTADVRAGLSHMARQWILACVQARKERDEQQRTRS
jgi:hypothetical protein